MQYLPIAKPIKKERDMISAFSGYNHNLRIKDYEFYDTVNVSSDLLPVMSVRNKRGRVRQLTKANGLFMHDYLCWVDGTSFYYNGTAKGTVADSAKQFVRMGAYVLIWPDAKYYNTVTDTFGSLGATFASVPPAAVTATLCRLNGDSYTYTAADTAPSSPTDGQYWIDTSDTTHYLKMYSESLGTWSTISTVYVKISTAGIDDNFSEGDGVTITGMDDAALNGSFVIMDLGTDYIIVTAIIDANVSQTTAIGVARSIPTMDYVTECANRVWGCSNTNHEIYACKLGDPKNWYVYEGVSTDSYAVTVGSGGSFTGATSHMGYVLFFKEDRIHKLYGNMPSNFVLSDGTVRGVASGSSKSIAVVNETLFYMSPEDVCAYGMALPEKISGPLGSTDYYNAVGGAFGRKYYVCLQYGTSSYIFAYYDTEKGVWIKEDTSRAVYMAGAGDDLYYIDASGYLWSVAGNITDYASGAALESAFTWTLETGDIGLDLPDNKYISGVNIMVAAAEGATLNVQYSADGGAFTSLHTFTSMPTKNKVTLPFYTPRCNSLKLKLIGSGDIKVYSITKTIESGSDVNV